jgi:LmbE family N-acetylglucosaminyl deacetylase
MTWPPAPQDDPPEASAALAVYAHPDDETFGLGVAAAALRQRSEMLVVFDEGGVTGHPDHQRATRAALAAADHLDIAVLA